MASFQHETNTFAPFATGLEQFQTPGSWPAYCAGAHVLRACAGLNVPIGGFIDAASGFDLVPICYAVAEPGGLVTKTAFEMICDTILNGITAVGPIDGLYLDLHGAMVTAHADDGEAFLLQRVRALVGAELPIVVSLDLHGNLGLDFSDLVTAMVIYRTYPHIDMAKTGRRAAWVFAQILQRKAAPFKSFRQADFLLPITAQSTCRQPAAHLYEQLPTLEGEGVLSVDLALAFPPADIPECGVSAGYDQAKVEAATAAVIAAVHAAEAIFDDQLIAVDEAVVEAYEMSKIAQRPILIADPQDNPGAGSSGDSTGILEALLAYRIPALLGMFWAPEAARLCHQAGVGSELRLTLGGLFPDQNGPAIEVAGRVERVSDGRFTCSGPMLAGIEANLGKMAVLRLPLAGRDEIMVVIGSNRAQTADQEIFRHIGCDPTKFGIVVVKSAIHFLADFEPIAEQVLFAVAEGQNPYKLDTIPYQKIRDGLRLGPHGPAFKRS
ncbi:MAG: M81 family metallopeptidase [Paracoccaceae bacterium]|nr:M81 family metallopeptidase [Paracoccaceae bacterium]